MVSLTKGWVQKLDDVFSAGDPDIRQWFLVRDPLLPLLLCLAYLVVSTCLGPALMKNKQPFDLRNAMVVFNFAVVATYCVCIGVNLIYIPQVGWHAFCYGAKMVYGEPSYLLGCSLYVIYVLKYAEFIDTVFFVLRKKQNLITSLHVIHHTVVPILGWIMIRMENSGMQVIPVLINAFVHVIMYSYYGLAAMGPRVRKYLWWKKYLTQLQMVQFIIIFLFVVGIVPLSSCTMKSSSVIVNLLSTPMFLYLFYRYYQNTFKAKEYPASNQSSARTLNSN